MKVPVLLVTLAGLIPISALANPEHGATAKLESVIEHHLEAMGGQARLRALKSVSYELTTTTADGATSTMTAVRARPNLVRFERTEGDATSVTAFDGKVAWSSENGKVEAITGDHLAKVQTKAAFDDILMDPSALGSRVTLAGKEKVAGKPAYVLLVKRFEGSEERRYIDAASFLEVQRTYTWSHEGKSGSKTIAFRDYQRVDGVMTAMTRSFQAEGKQGTTRVTRIEYDAPVAVAQFAMPAAPSRATAKK